MSANVMGMLKKTLVALRSANPWVWLVIHAISLALAVVTVILIVR